MGFTMLTILFVIIGFAYDPLKNNAVAAFVVLYCLIKSVSVARLHTDPAQLFPELRTQHDYLHRPGRVCVTSMSDNALILQASRLATAQPRTVSPPPRASSAPSSARRRPWLLPLTNAAQIMAFQLKDRGGKNAWINHLLQIFALFMLTGIFSTLLIPEVRPRSLHHR